MDIKKSVAPSAEYELYKRIQLIGQGAFGQAYLVECLQDNTKWVIKQMQLNSMTEAEQKQTLKQFRVLESLNHPNIVKFREVYKTKKGQLCMVMEYADGGDIAKRTKDQKGKLFDENVILDWFTQICLAIKHVHDRKIIHRDLKGANIFLNSKNIIQLGDFGIARVLSQTLDQAKTMVGTPYYLSPEIIENQPYSFKTDIWSMGVILYELCSLKPPFNADSLHFLALQIVRGAYPPLPTQYSKELQNLVAAMLNVSPDRRPSIHEILQMPVITNRIKNFLSETIRSSEFSHTIMHNKQFVNPEMNIQNIQSIANESPCPAHLIPKQNPPPQNPVPIQQPVIQPKPQTPSFPNNNNNNKAPSPSPSQPNLQINKPPSLNNNNPSQPPGGNKVSNPSPSNNNKPNQPKPNVVVPPPSNNLIPRPPSGPVNNKQEKQEDQSNPFDPKNAQPNPNGKPINYHFVNNNNNYNNNNINNGGGGPGQPDPKPPVPLAPSSNNQQRPDTVPNNMARKNSLPNQPINQNKERQATPQKEIKKEEAFAPVPQPQKPAIPPHPSSANVNQQPTDPNLNLQPQNFVPSAPTPSSAAPVPNLQPQKNIVRSSSSSDPNQAKIILNKQEEEEKLKQIREEEAAREQLKREKLQRQMEEKEKKEKEFERERLEREKKREEQRLKMHEDMEKRKKASLGVQKQPEISQQSTEIEEKVEKILPTAPVKELQRQKWGEQNNNTPVITDTEKTRVEAKSEHSSQKSAQKSIEDDEQEEQKQTQEIIKLLENEPEMIEGLEDQDKLKMIVELNQLLAGVNEKVKDFPQDQKDYFNMETRLLNEGFFPKQEAKTRKEEIKGPILMQENKVLDDSSDDDMQRDDDTDEPYDIDSTRDIINYGRREEEEQLKPLSQQEQKSISYLHDFSKLQGLRDYLQQALGKQAFYKAHQILQNQVKKFWPIIKFQSENLIFQFVQNDLNKLQEIHGQDKYQTLLPFIDENKISENMALLVTLIILEESQDQKF